MNIFKKPFWIVVILFQIVVGHGQGTIKVFHDNGTGIKTGFGQLPVDAPVRDMNGDLLASDNYVSQLWAGPIDTTFTPVSGTVTFNPLDPGYIDGGIVDTKLKGTIGVQIRVWDQSKAPTWQEAVSRMVERGKSNIDTKESGDTTNVDSIFAVPELNPSPWLTELEGFSLVPEPTIFVYALVGIVIIVLRRKVV